MTQPDPNRRFQIAEERALADWSAADPAISAALSACARTPDGVVVPFFGAPHLISHPDGKVTVMGGAPGKQAHISIVIVLLHYLLTADGSKPADTWIGFRELPDGLFYSQAFAGHAEDLLAKRFGHDLEGFRAACVGLRGTTLDLAEASYRFEAFPRIPVAVLLWEGDDEFPPRARILFDANAGKALPTEDLSGVGDWLAHRLTR